MTCLLDPIPTSLLNINIYGFLHHNMLSIVNYSLQIVFPTVLKTAIVKPPLQKSNLDVSIPDNYWPAYNLSFLNKILEILFLLSQMILNDWP